MKPLICGIQGTSLSNDEVKFFKSHNPLGVILFSRNCKSKEQILNLVSQIKAALSHDPLIFVDQEGGRVARIKPPIAIREYPPAEYFGDLYENMGREYAIEKVRKNYSDITTELLDIGINVNCAPVADIRFPDTDAVIGDRSFGSNVDVVTDLCQAAVDGIHNAGGMAILKHIPGHGRARCDSHIELPVVETSKLVLEETDFKVFKNVAAHSTAKMAMVAHIKYLAIDPENPATFSEKVVRYIREEIGFSGIIITDALEMGAVSGSYQDRATRSLKAGFDLLLHCNGKMDEMLDIVHSINNIDEGAIKRFKKLLGFSF